eukprot:1426848-Amphidinium_carterae.1
MMSCFVKVCFYEVCHVGLLEPSSATLAQKKAVQVPRLAAARSLHGTRFTESSLNMTENGHCKGRPHAGLDKRTLGVLGGGQLGRMMAEAAHRLGIAVLPLDPAGLLSPAGQVAGNAVEG